MNGKIPKYAVIQQNFTEKIKDGTLKAGTELPSESELMQQYQVSRVTARRAIEELYRSGYVEKVQGKRPFVKHNARIQELTTISSYTEEILKQGMTPSRKLVSSELRISTSGEAHALELQKADPVFHMERIYYADGEPLCFTRTSLPYTLFPDVETYNFESESLYHTLESRYDTKINTTTLKLKAVPAKEPVTDYLNVPEDFPLLYSSAVTYGIHQGKEVPIELFSTYYLTERFEYTLTQFRM